MSKKRGKRGIEFFEMLCIIFNENVEMSGNMQISTKN